MMSSAPPSDLLRDDEQATSLVRRGPWSIELRAGELENIRHLGRLVLRSVRAVVRDENWRTVPSAVKRVTGAESAVDAADPLVIEARTHDERVSLAWRLNVSARGDALRVDFRAEAEGDFLRNRLGLIVLHSPELAGEAVDVLHPVGDPTGTVFPRSIAPHQPAADIAGLEWFVGGETPTRCSLDFSGDVFEMEDQRNWTDASFKTYSTPLSEPFPVTVRAGDVIEQSLVLRCVPTAGWAVPEAAAVDSELVMGDVVQGVVVPALTTMASTATSVPAETAGTPAQTRWARELLLELDPLWSNWPAALARAISDAAGRPLDVRLVADDVVQAGGVLDTLAQHPSSQFARIGLFARKNHLADPESARSLVAALDRRGLDVQVIAGTRGHFTELNRSIDRLDDWRGPLTFSITPFMHDTSGHQLAESIAMQREVAHNALRLANGRPLHIGPITLGARFNAVATTAAASPTGADLLEGYGPELVPGATDPRTGAPSLGAWLLASVAALAAPTVVSLSYLEEWGPRSPSHPSAVQVLSWLSELAGAPVRHASAPGFAVLATGAETGPSTVVLVGNLGSEPRALRLPGSRVDIAIGPGEVRRFAGVAAPPRG
jgi:hypothetical protein